MLSSHGSTDFSLLREVMSADTSSLLTVSRVVRAFTFVGFAFLLLPALHRHAPPSPHPKTCASE